jgi:hypothetical protein
MHGSTSHDEIAATALSTYDSLPDRGKPKDTEWTVLAAFVLEEEAQRNNVDGCVVGKPRFRTVALGTGSKCLGRGAVSSAVSAGCGGAVLRDSHAEVKTMSVAAAVAAVQK